MNPKKILKVFAKTDKAVKKALAKVSNWGLVGENAAHSGQHHPDLEADAAALKVLKQAGFSILSEESGFHFAAAFSTGKNLENPAVITPDQLGEGEILVVMDPLDGSSNAARKIPFYALSMCAVDKDGPLAGYVSNLAAPSLPAYTAVRGGGARYGQEPIQPSRAKTLKGALVSVAAYPRDGLPEWLAPATQFRSMGASALEICLVASGGLDAYLNCAGHTHSPWDYLAGYLICQEAGAGFADIQGNELLELGMNTGRQTLAAGSLELLDEIKNLAQR